MTSQALAGSREGRLPLATCVGWGVGTLAVAALFNSVNVLLLRYLVDYVGLGAAVAGTILALSKLFDAVIDPLIGSLSDRTRSRHGRRRPFVLAGGVMLAAAAVLLFNIPSNLSPNAALALATGALLFYAAAYATFSVPYMAMPAEMTGNVHERSRLISYRVYAVAAASMVATFIGPLLIAKAGGGQAGHTVMSLFIATLVLVSTFVCFHATRDVAAADVAVSTHEKISFSRKLELILSNRPFMALLAIKLLQLMALAVTQAALPFLFKRVLGLTDAMLGVYFLVFYGAMIVCQRFWLKVSERGGKRRIYLYATIAYAVLYLTWYFVTPEEPLLVTLLRGAALGATAGAVLLFGQSMLPDTMEWDYRQTGLRREGVLSAIYTMVEKVAFAAGAAMTGLVLGAAGYIKSTGGADVVQPDSAISAIFFLASFAPMTLLLASCVALKFYNLSENMLMEKAEQTGA